MYLVPTNIYKTLLKCASSEDKSDLIDVNSKMPSDFFTDTIKNEKQPNLHQNKSEKEDVKVNQTNNSELKTDQSSTNASNHFEGLPTDAHPSTYSNAGKPKYQSTPSSHTQCLN